MTNDARTENQIREPSRSTEAARQDGHLRIVDEREHEAETY
jgi:hypothetical protein